MRSVQGRSILGSLTGQRLPPQGTVISETPLIIIPLIIIYEGFLTFGRQDSQFLRYSMYTVAVIFQIQNSEVNNV
jgi:hypothetical protein